MKMRVPENKRSAGLRHWHRRAMEYRASGLTTKGKPFLRHPNYASHQLALLAASDRNLASWSRRSVSRILDDLTTRSGRRVLRLRYFDSFILASEIEAVVNSLNIFFNELPNPAQAAALDLANHLAILKRRLKT